MQSKSEGVRLRPARSSPRSSSQDKAPWNFLAGEVFINCPYDPAFQVFLVAYIVAISAHGLRPRAACEFAGVHRLEKIVRMISECQASLHDFSRFGNRFNVPFEFGIAFGRYWAEPRRHICFGFSTSQRKIGKALSDLWGVDLHIHRSSRRRLFAEIANIFAGGEARPTIREMEQIYKGVAKAVPRLKQDTGAKSLFEPRILKEVVTLARALSDRIVMPKARA
jgi:hypothetical protein